MRVQTKAYGEIDLDDRQRVVFPEGILGFEDLKEYALLDAAQPPFYWLQSLQRVEIAFVMIEPTAFKPDYTPDVEPEDLAEIGLIGLGEDALVFAIVTIPEDARKMTANLQGPVIINRKTRMGRQFISTNPDWKVRHEIMAEMRVRESSC